MEKNPYILNIRNKLTLILIFDQENFEGGFSSIKEFLFNY